MSDPIATHTAALLSALDSQDHDTIRLALKAAQPTLWSFTPRDATREQRALDDIASEANRFIEPRCSRDRHFDDCSCAQRGINGRGGSK